MLQKSKLFMILLGSACFVQGCKMSSSEKLASGMGILSVVSSQFKANKGASDTAKQLSDADELERAEIASQEASDAAIESAIQGNFGLTLGQTFNTQKCIGKIHNSAKCQVSLNGNTFFKEAHVIFHPKTKKIAEITGVRALKHIDANDIKGSYRTRIKIVSEKMAMHPQSEGLLIFGALVDKGVFDKDYNMPNFGGEFYSGKTKYLGISYRVLKTNMGTQYDYVEFPFVDMEVSFNYRDKKIFREVQQYFQNKATEKRKSSLKGNF